MNWSRCSRVALAALLVATLAAAPVAAVSVSTENVPSEAEAGATIGTEDAITFTLTDLYSKYDSYTLTGQTDLEQAAWTVTKLNNQGDEIAERSSTGQSFSVQVTGEAASVQVRLEGEVPSVESFSYEPPQNVTLAAFAQGQQGSVSTPIESYSLHHYTNDSRDARQAIGSAAEVVDEGGAGSDLLASARSSFEAGNFQNAMDLANQAETAAENAQSTQSRNQLLMLGAGALLVLAVVGGVAYYVLNNRDTTDRLA